MTEEDAEYEAVVVDDAEREPSAVSGTMHVDLVSELGCVEMRPKMWYLSPGDEMGFHRQDVQEELYYVVRGPGRLRVGDEVRDVEEGTAIRVPPETPRQILNDTEDEHDHVWLVVGAPPVEDDGLPPTDDSDASA